MKAKEKSSLMSINMSSRIMIVVGLKEYELMSWES